ncbi:pyruvate dehydrogenase E2 component (dihydrolipoamide acetyltransferase) [Anaerolineales bacterium]|nr:pyruvate dehydrogenase E2 component (dihydrolipoamide acetyltransferase) [Anaerolineales bacterium]
MAEEFFVPKLGQTVEEVIMVGWLVEDGAKVSQGEAVMEVETDKAVFPVEANAKGYIHLGPYKAGDTIPVLTVVAIIGKQDDKFEVKGSAPAVEETESAPSVEVATAPVAESKSESPDRVFVSPRAKKLAAETSVDVSKVMPSGYDGIRVTERDVRDYLAQQPKASPVAQRMAADVGVDLREVAGSGPGGRIVKQDVARASQPIVAPVSQALPVADVIERIPLKGVRGIIAERMGASVHTTARVTLVMEVDATEFVAARERIKAKVSKDWGFAPGYNDLLAKVVAVALRQFPYMNARLAPDAIELMGHVNIGMAVDTERGLLVPVIKDADKKNLRQFGENFRRMVDGARSGRSLPDDLSGGTFTITNLGMYDIDAFTPVINLPEAAILGVGRIAPKAVPHGDQIVIRQMWTLSLVFDHRLVDGAPAARFLQMIKSLIEDPSMLMMYI